MSSLSQQRPPTNSKNVLPVAILAIGAVTAITIHPGLAGVFVLALITCVAYPYLFEMRSPKAKWARGGLLLAVALFIAFGAIQEPSQAQFFQGAQDFFDASFPDAGDATAIVFNVLRAIYLIYIAVALIGVVNSVRNNEEWQTAAKTPAIIVAVVTIGDVITTLITGV